MSRLTLAVRVSTCSFPRVSGDEPTVDSQMKRAGKQTERLVLDLRRSELDDKKSIRDVRQGMQGRHLTKVIVIDHAGNIVHIP